jgi:L-iditol 2-dehydrogenase
MATPPVDGAWAEYVSVRADFLHKLPGSLSYEEGALLEPLSVGFHAMRRGAVGPNDRVLISGLGPVGMLAAVAAQMFGTGQVIGSDVIPLRREMSKGLGIDGVINPLEENVRERILELRYQSNVYRRKD